MRPFLEQRSIEVRAVDLPSHGGPGASIEDDTFPATKTVEGDHLLIFRQAALVAEVVTTAIEELLHHAGDHLR